jgi:hypothetical protein
MRPGDIQTLLPLRFAVEPNDARKMPQLRQVLVRRNPDVGDEPATLRTLPGWLIPSPKKISGLPEENASRRSR